MKSIVKYDEMKKSWSEISNYHDGNISPTFELEVYKKMLNIFHVGDFYYYILNIPQLEMEFVSETIQTIIGIAPQAFSPEFIFQNMHPDDVARFALHEQKVTEFFGKLPPDQTLKYKVSYDYRLRCADGSYKWILMQTLTIQSDENGSVIRVLGVQTDITHIKSNNEPSGLSFLGLDGAPSFYNVPTQGEMALCSAKQTMFSSREREVLRWVLSGKSSAEIAEQLHLSIHTINSHRKNILSKSGCASLVELVSRAIQEGWV